MLIDIVFADVCRRDCPGFTTDVLITLLRPGPSENSRFFAKLDTTGDWNLSETDDIGDWGGSAKRWDENISSQYIHCTAGIYLQRQLLSLLGMVSCLQIKVITTQIFHHKHASPTYSLQQISGSRITYLLTEACRIWTWMLSWAFSLFQVKKVLITLVHFLIRISENITAF